MQPLPLDLEDSCPLQALPSRGSPASLSGYDENCLYLNIFSPNTSFIPSEGLPVLIFFHGGRYVTGSAATYPGENFSYYGNVVVVTVEYRLNVFGFAVLRPLVLSNKEFINVGLQDQEASIKWVYDNIPNFGGNPNKITISGQSAGASSVILHLTSGRVDGLISSAIVMSSWQLLFLNYESAATRTEIFANSVGCNGTDLDILTCMQTLPAARLTTEIVTFQPCIDGHVIKRPPFLDLAEGRVLNIPIIMGYIGPVGFPNGEATFDALYFSNFILESTGLTEIQYNTTVNDALSPWLTPSQINTVFSWYATNIASQGYWLTAGQALSDFFVVCPTILMAPLISSLSNEKIHAYYWNYTGSGNQFCLKFKICPYHGVELESLFDKPIMNSYTFNATDQAIAERFMASVAQFMNTGDPTSIDTFWPRYFFLTEQWQSQEGFPLPIVPFTDPFCNNYAPWYLGTA